MMNLIDLQRVFDSTEIEMVFDRNDSQHLRELFHVGDPLRLQKFEEGEEVYLGGTGELSLLGHFATIQQAECWGRIQSQPYFAQATDVRDNRVTALVVYGFSVCERQEALFAAVTDEALGSKREGTRKFSAVRDEILNRYSLRFNEQEYLLVGQHLHSTGDSFVLTNGLRAYSVALRDRGSLGEKDRASEKIYAITKGEMPFHQEQYRLALWKCGLRLEDATNAGKADAETQAFLNSGLERYLSLWLKYGEIEYDFVKDTAIKAGELVYTQAIVRENEVDFEIANPECIRGFLAQLRELGSDCAVDVHRDFGRGGADRFPKHGTLLEGSAEEKSVTIRFSDSAIAYGLGQEGSIVPNTYAAEVQFERRKKAFDRVFKRRSAKPNLALLIAGKGTGTQRKKKKMTPLNQNVLEQCFHGNTPTKSQRQAIEIALNTPDFAIIQGPPGTGKSTVIEAIITALSEKEKDPDLFFGRNLLTAYQKDATAHLAEELEIYGLPVISYQSRFGREEQERENDLAVTAWIEKKQEKLLEQNQRAADFVDLDILAAKLQLLQVDLQTAEASPEMLKSLLQAFRQALSPFDIHHPLFNNVEALRKIQVLEREIEQAQRGDELQELRYRASRQIARDLPTSDAAMSDDGPALIQRALDHFGRMEDKKTILRIVEVLRKLYGEEEICYRKVKLLKNKLLAELSENTGLLPNSRLRDQALMLLNETLQSIETAQRSDEEQIMARYLRAFEDKEQIKEDITRFMTVISATHQKTVSREVQLRKSEDEELVFDNVLIDEAARSCPPDLLIPLSCARDRMILVGDHKQLPQFVSDKVYDAIDDYPLEEKQAIIRDKPMFSHLIDQVRKLEKEDGICRFIQLSDQFRMPKTLGDLLSRHFYGGNLHSPGGNDPQYHDTNLRYLQGYHLLWLDVPGNARDREIRNENGSYYREAEAKRIVDMLHAVCERSQEQGEDGTIHSRAKNYSFGIITFYTAQKKRIQELLDQDPYFVREGINIELGTVDAFQGKEYDVVFLSLVRSNTEYQGQKRRFGITRDDQHLCVALSRAKRCMIVAGDSRMMKGRAAKNAGPALVEFYKMCQGEEVQDARIYEDQHVSAAKKKREKDAAAVPSR